MRTASRRLRVERGSKVFGQTEKLTYLSRCAGHPENVRLTCTARAYGAGGKHHQHRKHGRCGLGEGLTCCATFSVWRFLAKRKK